MKKLGIMVILAIIFALSNSYANPSSPKSINATAGNASLLDIFTSDVGSHSWAGYYGNITGTIFLKNTNNYSLYSWGGSATPTGEVYAANDTVSDWSSIQCMNTSSSMPGFNCTGAGEECLNVTEIEDWFGMGHDNDDGIDETFNQTLTSLMVGTKTLYNCPMVNLYVNGNASLIDYWNETLLTINETETIIFTAIINDDTPGFDNNTYDFQMIVGDNGDDSVPTEYIIYTELT